MSVTKTDKEVRFIQTTSADYSAQTEIISDAIYFLTDTKEIYVGSTKYSQSVNLKNGTGANSIMMLSSKEASGAASHAEGGGTTASGAASHAEGGGTTASGVASHAEGDSTTASGDASHAEGHSTTASAPSSHVEGESTRAGQQAFTITNWAPGEGANGTFTLSSVTGLAVGAMFSVLTRDNYFIVMGGEITSIDTAKNQIAVTITGDIDRLDNAKYLCLGNDPSLGDTNIGEGSHAEGYTTMAVGVASHAEGKDTLALGYASHVEGETSEASGYASHAEGCTMASGNYSHAEGIYTQAEGDHSHAEGKGARTGRKVFSVTDFSAESKRLTLSSVKGLAIGHSYSLIIEGNCILHCGNITSVDTTNNTITVDDCPPNVAGGSYIFTTDDPNLGDHTLGEGAHAEGESTKALEDCSHAEGYSTTASGTSSHSEGMFTEASGNSAHAEGSGTIASGYRSHAEGDSTTASGRYSHAEGRNTVAAGSSQHVQGKYNVEDSSGEYADIIGNGTANDNRSNAHTVDWSGNAWYAGDVYVGSTSGTNKDAGSKKLATEEYVDSKQVQNDYEQNDSSAADYIKNRPFYSSGMVEVTLLDDTFDFLEAKGMYVYQQASSLIFEEGKTYTVVFDGTSYSCIGYIPGEGAPAVLGNASLSGASGGNNEPFLIFGSRGHLTIATNLTDASHTVKIITTEESIKKLDAKYLPDEIRETTFSKMDKVNPTGTGSFSLNRKADTTTGALSFAEGSNTTASGSASHAEGKETTASGWASHAEGSNTTASSEYSHAEGSNTTASGFISHAEGDHTTASSEYSHAEGTFTTASGHTAHAEGRETTASGSDSHAEGFGTKASSDFQHVQGKFNIEDSSDTYADIIGNGAYETKRSNAHTVDWKGNAWYAGDVYVGSTSGTNKDAGSRKLIAVAPNAGAHNAIYRGDFLGSSVTEAQWAAIKAGTFDDMYIGDYWTIGGVNYRIAAFNYYYNTGDTACIENHITLVPDAPMYTHVMNDTGIATGAYVGSKMYTEGLAQAKTIINGAFGEAHVLKHRQYLQNAMTDGYASGGSWYDSTVELMTEQNVYGGGIFGNRLNGTAKPVLNTIDKSQYPLFAFRPDMISGSRQWYWLRDVVSDSNFAGVHNAGFAHNYNASDADGVRPAFSIYQS